MKSCLAALAVALVSLGGCAPHAGSKPAEVARPAANDKAPTAEKKSPDKSVAAEPAKDAAEPDPGPLVAFSMLKGKVTGRLPQDWKKQEPTEGLKGRTDREALQFFIPYPETDNTPDSANALLLAFEVPADMSIKEFSDQLLGDSLDPRKGGAATLKDISEGSWRLIIARGLQDKTQYALLHRFGVANGVGVDLLVAVPVLEHGNEATVDRIIAQFGATAESITLAELPAK